MPDERNTPRDCGASACPLSRLQTQTCACSYQSHRRTRGRVLGSNTYILRMVEEKESLDLVMLLGAADALSQAYLSLRLAIMGDNELFLT